MLDFILNPWTFGGFITLLAGGGAALWFTGLWPVFVAMLKTPEGRKALLIAAGSFLLWAFSMFLYTRGKQNVQRKWNEAEQATRERAVKVRNDGKRDAADPGVRDPNDRYNR